MRCVPFAGRRYAHRALTPPDVTWQVAAQSGQYIKYQCKKGACGTCEVRVDGKWIRTCVSQARHRACHRAPYRVSRRASCRALCRASHSKVRLPGTTLCTAPSCGGQVPYVDPGQTYKVQVKSSMKKAKSASGFYSFRCDSAAANPPCAQGTPPARAPGANPNCLCGCRSIFAGMKNNIVGMFGFLREGRKSQSRCRRRARAWPPHALARGRDAVPGPRPHPPPLPCCLAPWTFMPTGSRSGSAARTS